VTNAAAIWKISDYGAFPEKGKAQIKTGKVT